MDILALIGVFLAIGLFINGISYCNKWLEDSNINMTYSDDAKKYCRNCDRMAGFFSFTSSYVRCLQQYKRDNK